MENNFETSNFEHYKKRSKEEKDPIAMLMLSGPKKKKKN